MIDNLALGLTHLLMIVAAWLLLRRSDLDAEPPQPGTGSGRDGGPGA